MTCAPIKDLLTRYVLGDLEPADRARVEAHLASCPACRAAAEDLRPTVTLLQQALAAQAGQPLRLDPSRRARILAARGRREPKVTVFPVLLKVAALFAVLFVFAGLLLPALSGKRERARMVSNLGVDQDLGVEVVAPEAPVFGAPVERPGHASTIRRVAGVSDPFAAGPADSPAPAASPEVRVDPFGAASLDDRAGAPAGAVLDQIGAANAPESVSRTTTRLYAGTDAASPPPADSGVGSREVMAMESAQADAVQLAEAKPVMTRSPLVLKGLYGRLPANRQAGAASASPDAKVRSFRFQPSEKSEEPDEGTVAPRQEALAAYGGRGQVNGSKEKSPSSRMLPGREMSAMTAADKDLGRKEDEERLEAEPPAMPAVAKTETVVGRAIEDRKTLVPEESAKIIVEPLGPDDLTEAAPELAYPAQVFHPIVESKQTAVSTFGIDVDTASFTLARRYLLQGRRPPEGAVRVEEFVNAFDYAYRAPERETFAVYTDRARSPFRPGMEVLRIGVRGKVIGRDRMRPSTLTFVIDTSGSMNTPDRLDLIRQALGLLVDRLGPEDTVTVVAFGSEARLVLDRTPAAQKDVIHSALNNLQTHGSTHLEAGLRLAYEVAARHFRSGAINRVLLLSDGVANLGAATAREILAQVERYRQQGITCSVFGVGQGTYNDAMLEALADKGDGVYRYVDSPAEARRVFVDDLAATLCVIAKDVKIQVEFNPERVTRYRQIGYENRRLEKEQFRDDTVDAGEVGAGQSATALYEIEVAGPSDEPLGIVRLRWKDADTGKVEERAFPVRAGDRYASFEKAPVRFRLAAGVAELADLLRRNPYTAGTTGRDVAGVIRPVALELHLDSQVQDLARMVNAVRE